MNSQQIQYVYWFAYYSKASPSVRYRAEYPLNYLKDEQGVNSILVQPGYAPKAVLRFLSAWCGALFWRKKNALVVIQKVRSNFIYANLLKLLVVLRPSNTVYDLDDADYLYCPPKTIYFFSKRCAAVAAGSKAIAEHLSKFNANVKWISSPPPDLNVVKKNRNEKMRIGWIGGYSGGHKKSLNATVFPAIEQLGFPCEFELLGVNDPTDKASIEARFANLENIDVLIPLPINWFDELDIQHRIAGFDVGIATLLDDPIQRAKSGIKAKQYLNSGVPVLSTNLPENNSVLKDAENGFFCDDAAGFVEKLNAFNAMHDNDYHKLSTQARKSVSEHNTEVYWRKYTMLME